MTLRLRSTALISSSSARIAATGRSALPETTQVIQATSATSSAVSMVMPSSRLSEASTTGVALAAYTTGESAAPLTLIAVRWTHLGAEQEVVSTIGWRGAGHTSLSRASPLAALLEASTAPSGATTCSMSTEGSLSGNVPETCPPRTRSTTASPAALVSCHRLVASTTRTTVTTAIPVGMSTIAAMTAAMSVTRPRSDIPQMRLTVLRLLTVIAVHYR